MTSIGFIWGLWRLPGLPPSLRLGLGPSEPQRSTHMASDLLIILLSMVSPQLARIDVGAALRVWFRQHRHHTQQDLLDALHRRPPFLGPFVLIGVFAWRMENRDTHRPIGVDVWMQQRRLELERRWTQRIVFGER